MRVIALVGAHGVGKTTAGRRLADRLGVRFDEEIGAALAADPRWRNPETGADADQPAFDAAVIRSELDRDVRSAHHALRVVESWHPGNLAYAERRSPATVAALAPLVRVHPGALCVPLLAPPEVLATRAHERGDLAFFEAVGHAAALWAARLGLRVTRPVWTHAAGPDAIVDQILQRLEEAHWTTCS